MRRADKPFSPCHTRMSYRRRNRGGEFLPGTQTGEPQLGLKLPVGTSAGRFIIMLRNRLQRCVIRIITIRFRLPTRGMTIPSASRLRA